MLSDLRQLLRATTDTVDALRDTADSAAADTVSQLATINEQLAAVLPAVRRAADDHAAASRAMLAVACLLAGYIGMKIVGELWNE